MPKRQNGFTLIELSIVLVILGLMVGAIVGGQSLIRAAELQGLIRDQSAWQTAYNAFLGQYDAKPGDFPEAYDYWSGGVDTVCGEDSDYYNNGCNGNGDNILGRAGDYGQNYNAAELNRAWMHMQLAEIINGRVGYVHNVTEYQRAAPRALSDGTWFNSVPQAKGAEGDAGWMFQHPAFNGDAAYFGKSGAWVMLGATTGGWALDSSTLLAKDAAAIDKKLDDGGPTTGNVTAARGVEASADNCASNGAYHYDIAGVTPSTLDTYSLGATSAGCVVYFYIGD